MSDVTMKKQVILTIFFLLHISLFAQRRLDFQNILKSISSKPVTLGQVKNSLESEPQLQKIDNMDFYYFSNVGAGVELMDVDEAISDIIIYPKIYSDSFSTPFFYKKNLSLTDVSQQQGAPLFIRWERSSNSLFLTYQDADENKFIYKAIIKEVGVFTDGAISYSFFVGQLKKIGNTPIETIKIDLNAFKMPARYIVPPPMVHFNKEIQKTEKGANENFNNTVKVDSVGNKFWKIGGKGDQSFYDIVNDNFGNIYIATHFEKEAVCGGKRFLTKGRNDILICKYTIDGEYLWGTQIQVNSESPLAENVKLNLDKNGNLYFSGLCSSPIKVENLVVGQKEFNIFSIKFNSAGKPIWKKEVNSEHYMTFFNNAEVDEDGNLNVLFSFGKNIVIGKDTLQAKKTNTLGLIKYSPDGKILLTKSLLSSEFYFKSNINKSGNISLLVRLKNDKSVDTKVVLDGSEPNFMILKFNANGDLTFQKEIQLLGVFNQSFLEDKKGDIVIEGRFGVAMKFNNQLFESESEDTFFFIKVDSQANFTYFRQIAAKEHHSGNKIYLDNDDSILFFGNCEGLVKAESEVLMPSISNKRSIYIKYNKVGELQEMKQFSEGLNDKSATFKIGKVSLHSNNFIVSGVFNSTQNVGYTSIKPDNEYDILIGKYQVKSNFLLDKTALKSIPKGVIERDKIFNNHGDSVKKSQGNGINSASEVAFDKLGNKYIYGTCGDAVRIGAFKHFAPSMELFVAKFDKNDSLIWFKSIRREGYLMSSARPETGSLRIANDGSILISGVISGVNFADNLKVTSNEFSKNQDFGCYFLCKIDINGKFIWFKNTGIERRLIINNTNFFELDKNDNIYIVGKIYGQTFNMKQDVGGIKQTDFFLSKYDKSGNQVWFKLFGSEIDDKVEDLEITKEGEIYLVGNVGKNITFDQQKFSLANPKNGFIAKLNGNGVMISIQNVFSDAIIKKLKIAQNGEFVLSGDFTASINYKNSTLNSDGWQDSFVGLFDKNILPKWLNRFGTASYESVNDIVFDKSGNLYALFYQTDNIKSRVISVNKYTVKGDLKWSKSIKSTESLFSNNMSLDSKGNICLVGAYKKEMCFDGSCLYSLGTQDFFLTSFSTK